MAASPRIKVYSPAGEYIAACKYADDAAVIVAARGDGSTIRDGHARIVWTEGAEDQPAGDSYDHAAEIVYSRMYRGEGA